jgi:purine-nucleoside phosphorylase
MDKVQRFAEMGVLAVEMECTALMAIAMYRNVDFAAALVITDELFRGEWTQGFGSPDVIRQQEFLCQTLAGMFSS